MVSALGRESTIYKAGATIGGVLVVLLACITLGLLAIEDTRLVTGKIAPAEARAAASKSPPDVQKTALSPTSASNLFGARIERKEKPAPKATPTRLDLTLKATFTNEVKAQSYALISDKSGKTQSVATGGDVAPGVTLKSVATGFVVLSRNGRDETLHLPILGDNSERQNRVADKPALPQKATATARAGNTVIVGSPVPDAPPASQPQRATQNPALNEQAELRRQKLMERLQTLRNRK